MKPKSNSVVTVEQIGSGMLEFTVLGAGAFTFDPTKAHDDNREHAELHGWTQRISDRAAIGRDPETGKPATPAQKFERMRALAAYYETGAPSWSTVQPGEARGGILLEALTAMYAGKKTRESLAGWLKGKSRKERAALLASDAVRPFADAIRAKAGESVDVEALLDEIE